MIQGLPDKLKALRLKHGYSQREVATRLRVSPSIVSGYETGERTPSLENLLALSYLYKCSTDYLLGKTQNTVGSTLDASGLKQEQIQTLNLLIDFIKLNSD